MQKARFELRLRITNDSKCNDDNHFSRNFEHECVESHSQKQIDSPINYLLSRMSQEAFSLQCDLQCVANLLRRLPHEADPRRTARCSLILPHVPHTISAAKAWVNVLQSEPSSYTLYLLSDTG
jgi:hypothetical protein